MTQMNKTPAIETPMLKIAKYDKLAEAGCDYGTLMVLTNSSTHFFLVEVECDGAEDGKLVGTFSYAGRSMAEAYREALEAMVRRAIEFTEEAIVDFK